MTITREWLNWDSPCLPQAAAWLVARPPTAPADGTHHHDTTATAGECDLRDTLCVLPGSRAGRLLLVELLRVCDERGLRLVPPRVFTPGAMTDELLNVTGAIAGDFESHLAWMEALRRVDHEAIRSLLPELIAPDDWPALDALATTLGALHESLAGERASFATAGEKAADLSMPSEGERWRAIAAVHAQHRLVLAGQRLVDRHDAREAALAKSESSSLRGATRVVLIGVADLNAMQKVALRRHPGDVIALIHAPASEADAFDDLGTVKPDAWLSRNIDTPDDHIAVVERPVNQAQEALRFIDSLDGTLAPSQITLGLGDAASLGDLSVAAEWAGFAIHDPLGSPLRRSAPYRMLAAAVDWLEEPRFEHLAALLRHVDVERWVRATAKLSEEVQSENDAADSSDDAIQLAHVEWLTLLDEYFAEHLQGRLTGKWLGDRATRARLRAVHDAVQALLAPLNADANALRPLHEWCQPMLDVLANAYAIDAPAGSDAQAKPVAAALESIDAVLAMRDALSEIAAAAPGLQPRVNAATALRLLLDHLAETTVRPQRQPRSIEALGWLELHLDPAPALAILNVNDGAIPEAVTGHAFVPDSLRSALGMADNARRYARDAYLMQAIVRSRPHVRLIVGRRSPQGDPLAPSRLLLACDDATLVRRVRDFAEDRSQQADAPPIGLPEPAQAQSRFTVPKLPSIPQPPAAMRVTDFATYLRCPYRYALARLLKLQAFDDDAAELNPMSFGNLAHRALATLGDDKTIAAETTPDAIFAYLLDQLHDFVKRDFGSHPLPALRLQIARLEQRLRSFSRFHAGQTREGWRIEHCELCFGDKDGDLHAELDVPGQSAMPIRGRIDRIDRHEATGRWRIIDYKTSESAKSPYKTHHDRSKLPDGCADLEWCDLQLPLYHLLATRCAIALPADQIELGYIALPKQSDGVEWQHAEWSAEQIEHGLDAARDVVRAIRRGEFDSDRMERDIDAEYDDFARICQTSVFRSESEDPEEADT